MQLIFLRSRGVKVFLDERVTGQQGDTFTTDRGCKIDVDMAFLCTGIVSNSSFLKDGPLQDSLDTDSNVIVNQFLQLKGFPTIFAAGDICNVKEEKLAQNAEAAAHVVVENILHYDKGKNLIPYKPTARIKVISLGKYDGITVYNEYTITGFISALMKEFVEWMVMISYRYLTGKVLV